MRNFRIIGSMDVPTKFEWDADKAELNLVRHGVPFPFAARVFLDPAVLFIPTIRFQDGEDRYKAVGMIDQKTYAVVFVMRGDVCRLISARRTNAKEDRSYGNR